MITAFDTDIHGQFCATLRDHGIVPPDPLIADGKLHRCAADGHEGGSDASYILHCDGFPAGGFRNWCDGTGWRNWRADLDRMPTAEELAELHLKAEADRAQREAEEAVRRDDARRKADAIWSNARPCTEHPYLSRKGVQAHGLQVTSSDDLVVPLHDADGLLHSLQFITSAGAKKYLHGGRVTGCYATIGGKPSDIIMIGEGFATCASAYEAVGYPVAVAFDCGNLLAVAAALRAKYPAARIVLLADDDYRTDGNPGRSKAREAAAAVGGVVAIPDFGSGRPDGATDFNDLALHAGAEAVRQCIARSLAADDASGENASWPVPDVAVLRLHRRPPSLPLEVLGPEWADWVASAAEAAVCPVDYVAAPLLATASTLVGNARWAQATPGWSEPPHLWVAVVGDSGNGKSPGADCLLRDILPELERRMAADFPDQLRLWRAASEIAKAVEEGWKSEVRAASKAGKAPPAAPDHLQVDPEPQSPRLRQNDVTIEKVAALLAASAPKGLLIVRDELAGWITGMCSYNNAGRAFWIEAFGGRPYRVERQKNPDPIIVPRLVVAVYGGIQPDRLSPLMREGDDGLLARILWGWPELVPFKLGTRAPGVEWAINALDRLRWLDLQPGDPPHPIKVPLVAEALPLLEEFARDMQQRQIAAGGLLRSALGKTRGQLLRLSLVLEMLWWCGSSGAEAAPTEISIKAFTAAAVLLDRYFLPMAERVYGDAALSDADRHAATVARWIIQNRPTQINARDIRRKARLPGLSASENVQLALTALVEADWITRAPNRVGVGGGRPREDYVVNPRVFEDSLHASD